MRRAAAALLALALVVASPIAPISAAQEAPAPPDLGESILEDPLAGSGVLRPNFCPTGRNAAQYVADGFQLKVTGRCAETNTIAYLVSGGSIFGVPDGEIRVAVQLAEGAERSRFLLWGRTQGRDQEPGGYAVVWEVGQGTVVLQKSQGSQSTVLAR